MHYVKYASYHNLVKNLGKYKFVHMGILLALSYSLLHTFHAEHPFFASITE